MKRKAALAAKNAEPTEEQLQLIIKVNHCAKDLDDMLQGARRKSNKNVAVFASTHIGMLFRASNVFHHMYERLGYHSRDTLVKELDENENCEGIKDARDEMRETEGLWQNFLNNVDAELKTSDGVEVDGESEEEEDSDSEEEEEERVKKAKRKRHNASLEKHFSLYPSAMEKGDKLDLTKYRFQDIQTSHMTTLGDISKQHNLTVVLCQPIYLPSVISKWFIDSINKKYCRDFHFFNVNFVLILFGAEAMTDDEPNVPAKDQGTHQSFTVIQKSKHGFSDAKKYVKMSQLPLLTSHEEVRGLTFDEFSDPRHKVRDTGFSAILWDSEGLVIRRRKLLPLFYGFSRMWHINNLQFYGQQMCQDRVVDLPPLDVDWTACKHLGGVFCVSKEGCVIAAHASRHSVTHLPSFQEIYNWALQTHVSVSCISIDKVKVELHKAKYYRLAPDPQRFKWDITSKMYIDPLTDFYYEENSQYYYDKFIGEYLYWNNEERRYKSAQERYESELKSYEEKQRNAAEQLAQYDAAIAEAKRLVEVERQQIDLRGKQDALMNTLQSQLEESHQQQVLYYGRDLMAAAEKDALKYTNTHEARINKYFRASSGLDYDDMTDLPKPPGT